MIRRLAFALLAMAFAGPAVSQDTFSPAQKKEIGEIIRSYLLKNPEVMSEVAEELEKRGAAAAQAGAVAAIKENKTVLERADGDPVGGDPNGKITVVEFFDYNCPYCRKAKPVVQRLLRDDKRIRYVFKEFPILSETSKLAARVALAVWKLAPDKYVALHNDLMKSNGRVNERRIRKVVESAGLQWDKVLNASKAPDIEAKISDNLALAQKLNINGTPTFIIGEKIFPGLVSLTTMKSAVSTAETSN